MIFKKRKIIKLLLKKNLTVSTAESCTGGFLSKVLTDYPGSSAFFLGGIVAYSNSVKEKVLNVSHNSLIKYGAVSEPVCKEMCINVSKIIKSDIGLSVTGIAGPSGGSVEKPVGTVFIGICFKKKVTVKKFIFKGLRKSIREQTVKKTLELLYSVIS